MPNSTLEYFSNRLIFSFSTTLQLLKFPWMLPTPTKIQSHRQRCLRPARIKTTPQKNKKKDSLKIIKKKDYRKSVDGRYKCPFNEICSYTSRYGNNLAKHVRIHTGEKRYSCDFCVKRFTDPSSRAKHMLTHPESGAVKCKQCSVFFMPLKLEDHMINCKRNYAKQEPTNWCNKGRFPSLYFRESQGFEKNLQLILYQTLLHL